MDAVTTMRELGLSFSDNRRLNVLCLGAHCDDIEIGCGGTILTLVQGNPNVSVHWVVYSSTPERELEARRSADAFLGPVQNRTLVIHGFRDGFFPYVGAELKECFEELKRQVQPDVIFTHCRDDLHQDHRLVSELTWNTFRNHLILEYEIPKYDGDLGRPTVFVPITDAIHQQKIAYLVDCYPSQRERQWFSPSLFSAILRLRGMEANASSTYAEAFYARKLRLHLTTGEFHSE